MGVLEDRSQETEDRRQKEDAADAAFFFYAFFSCNLKN